MNATSVLKSIDRHFAVGCPALSALQLRAHQLGGTCAECRNRTTDATRDEQLAKAGKA